jgi:phosphate transport system permease protein
MKYILQAITYIVILLLFGMLGIVLVKGFPVLSIEFLTTAPSDGMTAGGIFPCIVGTILLLITTALISFPLGILAGIYNAEYSSNKIKQIFALLQNTLSGVPSIVFGLFGMAFFVNAGLGESIIAGSLTLSLLTLPLIERLTEEAILQVDVGLREASLALGASKLTTIVKVILPAAMPNIITGLILSISRVSGETAPIMFTVAAYFLPRLPDSIFSQVMVLPYHLYVLATSGTGENAMDMAYGTALVLIILVVVLNIIANFVRKKAIR